MQKGLESPPGQADAKAGTTPLGDVAPQEAQNRGCNCRCMDLHEGDHPALDDGLANHRRPGEPSPNPRQVGHREGIVTGSEEQDRTANERRSLLHDVAGARTVAFNRVKPLGECIPNEAVEEIGSIGRVEGHPQLPELGEVRPVASRFRRIDSGTISMLLAELGICPGGARQDDCHDPRVTCGDLHGHSSTRVMTDHDDLGDAQCIEERSRSGGHVLDSLGRWNSGTETKAQHVHRENSTVFCEEGNQFGELVHGSWRLVEEQKDAIPDALVAHMQPAERCVDVRSQPAFLRSPTVPANFHVFCRSSGRQESFMRAVVVESWGGPVAVVDLCDPTPAPGHTIVEMCAAAVGHLDATVVEGALPKLPALPHVPGVEGSGVVLESDRFEPGSKVVVRGAGVGLTVNGCWAMRVCAPDEAIQPWPEGMDAALAATYFVPATTAAVALHEVGELAPGETVFITGAAGAVGTLAGQLALRAGARVIAVASDPAAVRIEGCVVIDASDEAAQRKAIAESGCSFIVDTVGGPELTTRASWLPSGGRVAVVGYTRGQTATLHVPSWLMSDVSLRPVNTIARAAAAASVAPALAQALLEGALTLDVTTAELDQLPVLFDRLRSGAIRGRAAVLCPSR